MRVSAGAADLSALWHFEMSNIQPVAVSAGAADLTALGHQLYILLFLDASYVGRNEQSLQSDSIVELFMGYGS